MEVLSERDKQHEKITNSYFIIGLKSNMCHLYTISLTTLSFTYASMTDIVKVNCFYIKTIR